MVSGGLVFDQFQYAFLEGTIPTGPTGEGERVTVLKVQGTPAQVTAEVIFRAADLAEFKRLVAALQEPSVVQVVPASALPKANGHALPFERGQ